MLLILVSKKTSFASSILSFSGTDDCVLSCGYSYVKRHRQPTEAKASDHGPCELKHMDAIICRRFVDVASGEEPVEMEEERRGVFVIRRTPLM